ncbi:MAG: sulfide/dihydroorotate dehydrogenase-like FAD/NAD-binding protein, partial [Bacteroidales bacterium]|nr:sulfide/dihydroorotate dehydrogenase-like FAD/NAD-binding protein [Bacteroidales bacterium]
MYKIVKKERLSPVVWRFVVEVPRLASAALPGQFLIVHSSERGERIPLTISNYDREAGTVEMVIQEIGASTKAICAFEAGSSFADVVGPLGLPSDFTSMSAEELSDKRYVFIGGGVGAAPVHPQARWLHEHGVPVDVIIGAKNSEMLIFREEMSAVCDNLHICTDDGSEGFHGLVTAMLEKLVVEQGANYTNVVAIGPMIMMKFATLTAQKLG